MSIGPNWFDKASDQIDSDLENGLIDAKEHRAQMRDLQAEFRQGAEDAARDAYDNYAGGW